MRLVALFFSLAIPVVCWSTVIAFNNDARYSYYEPYRHIQRNGVDLESLLIKEIGTARKRIWIAVQEINLPRLAQALAAKKRAGVDVRVVIENMYNVLYSKIPASSVSTLSSWLRDKYKSFLVLADSDRNGRVSLKEKQNADALYILKKAGIPVIDDTADGSLGTGLMHHKFMVIDSKRVSIGSANFTLSGMFGDFANGKSRGNTNVLSIYMSTRLASLFEQEFSIMWGTATGSSLFGINKPYRGPQKVKLSNGTEMIVSFSPFSASIPWQNTSNGLIARTVAGAKKSISFALFVFSAQKIADAMKQVQRNGVKIGGFVEKSFATAYYSELLDLLGLQMRDANCMYEEENRPWPIPAKKVGTTKLPYGDKLHHKFAVVDSNITIYGSHNWSAQANKANDETLLIVKNSSIATEFNREIKRLAKNAFFGATDSLLYKIKEREYLCNQYNY